MSIITLEELYKSDDKFYRLTNPTENHRGFQYNTGLNVDTQTFNPTGKCMGGGMYFFSSLQLEHFYMHCFDMKYIREVTFEGITTPQIYSEEGKYKCHSFVLSPRKPFYIDDPSLNLDVLSIISIRRDMLKHVKEQTPEVCLASVLMDGYALKHVKEQTPELCLSAVSKNAYALQYVKEQTQELCLASIFNNGNVLQYVKEQTPEVCLAAVSDYGNALQYVKEQTPELCLAAVSDCGNALQYVKEQTPELCLAAVSDCGNALQYVKEQTPELCLVAVSNCGRALQYVKEQTPELRLAANYN
jgi:hypothetical protein